MDKNFIWCNFQIVSDRMKLSKSVHSKIFFGFISLLSANVVMFILCIAKLNINDTELNFKISFIIGGISGFLLEKKLNTIPYDKYDNYNMIFFVFMLLALILLIGQGVFFGRYKE